MAIRAMLRRGKSAVVLGCGPAGLFAAHALLGKGYSVEILSRLRRSEMFGAQYLHRPIPGLDGDSEPAQLIYQVWGTAEEYRKKVYGDGINAVPFVSPEKFKGEHEVWDIRRAYYDAFSRYLGRITDYKSIDHDTVNDLVMSKSFDLIVSTIPAIDICTNPTHVFRTQPVLAIGDAPERGVFCPIEMPPMTVVCNGNKNPGWYRASNVFGYKTAEWPDGTRPPISAVASIQKPTGTTCDCWKGKVLKLGRFGTWEKDQYSHHAYYTLEAQA